MSAGNRSEKSKAYRAFREHQRNETAEIKRLNGGLGAREVRRIASGKRKKMTNAEMEQLRSDNNKVTAAQIAKAPKKDGFGMNEGSVEPLIDQLEHDRRVK